MLQENNKIQSVQVISRAAEILRTLREDTKGLSLGQIATRVNLPRSTVQRIVNALTEEGFIATGPGHGGLRLGPEMQSFAQAGNLDLKDRMRPLLQQIAGQTGETVDLAVLQGNRVLFVDQVVGSQRLRTVSSIGETFPLTTTANGKAALGCLEESEAARLVIAELEVTEQPRNLMKVLAEIDMIRQGALATDEGEHTDGISAIGFALRDMSGDVSAISVPVPSSRFDRIKPILTDVLTQARETWA